MKKRTNMSRLAIAAGVSVILTSMLMVIIRRREVQDELSEAGA